MKHLAENLKGVMNNKDLHQSKDITHHSATTLALTENAYNSRLTANQDDFVPVNCSQAPDSTSPL